MAKLAIKDVILVIISSTEVQNNFGKYLMLAAKEDIIITRNGTVMAKLCAAGHSMNGNQVVQEKAAAYSYGGRKATYDEFLELTKDTEDRYEYIDGEIYYLASPKTAHQVALAELFGIFYNWFQGKPCSPLVAPYDITLRRNSEDLNIVQPDIMVICDLETNLDKRDYYQGIPTLVVEILSEGTRRKDLIKKLDLYMSCGIREYWLVNPLNKEITIYQFADGDITNHITYKIDETAQSFSFQGLSAELTRIFK